ncbi:MAG: VOC family protein [Bacteroidota bacterium]
MKLNQVTLPSLDLARGVAFYEQLGLTLIVDALPRYVRLACPGEGSTLSLHLVAELPKGEARTVIYFECEDLDERVGRLQAAGLTIESGPRDESWLWREARLKDPDGNPVCLYFAGENRLNPPWRIPPDA